MVLLELDVGNTRLKWRIASPSGVSSGDILRLAKSNAEVVSELCTAVADFCVGCVSVASVADSDFSSALKVGLSEGGLPEPEFAYVTAEASGVVCGYSDVSRLGVDRWLVVLAAHHMSKHGAVVVDCGSAITVDVVYGGCHLGGYIVPGLRLMIEALFAGTDRVKVTQDFDCDLRPGCDTSAAVNRGVLQMVVGLVAQAVREWPGDSGRIPVLLTGGDAADVKSVIETGVKAADVRLCPDLVMDGLRYCKKQLLGSRN